MANLDQIQLPDNTSHYTKTIFRGETGSTSTSTAFVVTVSGITSLYDGLTVVIKNTVIASASGCTLNVSGTGAKTIWVSYSNVACTTHWGLNQTYLFIYDLTNDRWELQQGRDRDNEYIDYEEYEDLPEWLKNNGKAYYINNIPNNGYKTVSGAVCSFADGADDVPMPSVKATITAVQTGSGDPSPSNVRAISGFAECDVVHTKKNVICSNDASFPMSENGIACPAVTSGNKNTLIFEGHLSLGKWTLKENAPNASNTTHQMALIKNGTIVRYITVDPYTFTVESEDDIYKVRLYVYPNNAESYVKPQLEKGDAATTYESYTSETIPVWMGGVNLWGGEKMADDVVTAVNNSSRAYKGEDTNGKYLAISAGNGLNVPWFTNFKENTQYTIILKASKSNTATTTNIRFYYTDDSTSAISFPESPVSGTVYTIVATSTANKTIKQIEGVYNSGITYVYYDQSGLFEGVKTAQDFVPVRYIYGGELNLTTGVLTITAAWQILRGNMLTMWSASIGGAYGTLPTGWSDWAKKDGGSAVAFSHGKATTRRDIGNVTDGIIIGDTYNINSNYIILKLSGCSSLIDSKTAVETAYTSNTPMTVVYELATPTTIQLTPEEVRSFLGTNNLWANTGDSEVTYYPSLSTQIRMNDIVFSGNGYAEYAKKAGNVTWRDITVGGNSWKGTGTDTGALNFVQGSNVTLTSSGNDLTIAATDTTYTGTGAISVNSSTHVISTTAEANQNAFSNIKVGSTTIAADSKTDTLELVAGDNVTLTPDATNDKVTIAATDTTYSNATTSASGLMSASDKAKLNTIPTNGYSDWAYISPSNVTDINGAAGNQRYLATITVPAHTLRLYDIAVDLTKGADGGQADLVVSTTKGATTPTGSTPSGAGDAFQYTAKTIAPCPATGHFFIKLSTQIRNNTASSKTYQLNLRRYLGGSSTLTATIRYSQIEYPA